MTSRLTATPEAGATLPVRAASTTNIIPAGQQTIAGVALVAGDRCLVLGQTDATENGVYVVSVGSWRRAKDLKNADNGALVLDINSSILYRAIFTGTYDPGVTSITFSDIEGVSPFSDPKTVVVSDNTIITAASGNLAATELNAALAELDSDLTAAPTVTGKIDETGVTYENLDANGDVGFGSVQVPAGNLTMPFSQIGTTGGKVLRVGHPVVLVDRAATVILGKNPSSLNYEISDSGGTLLDAPPDITEPDLNLPLASSGATITAFYGVAGVTYHCRTLGPGMITHHATDLIITQGGQDVQTEAGDTFDVEMTTGTTCRIKNYVRSRGDALFSRSDGPAFRAYADTTFSVTGSASTYTKVPLNQITFDTNSKFDNVNYRFTPQVDGYYKIIGSVLWAVGTNTTNIAIVKNGTDFTSIKESSTDRIINIIDIVYLDEDDYIELWVKSDVTQNASGFSTTTFMSGSFIREA